MLLPFRKLLKANIPFKITQELKIFKIFNSFAVPWNVWSQHATNMKPSQGKVVRPWDNM